MYHFVKTIPLDILGENEDSPLKDEFDSATHKTLFDKVVSGSVLRARPDNGDILYFLFKEEDSYFIDLMRVDTVEEVSYIPSIFDDPS